MLRTFLFVNTWDSQPAKNIKTRGKKVSGLVLPPLFLLQKLLSNVTGKPPEWDLEEEVCEWGGLTCDEEKQVIRISWEGMKLKGTLSWKNLPPTLTVLQLGIYNFGNELTGSVETSLLPVDLQMLRIDSNLFFGHLSLAELPPALLHLSVSFNQFSHNLDTSRLPLSLRRLRLSHNAFHGPLCLSSLPPGLKLLQATNNHFAGELMLGSLPPRLGILHLQFNSFVGHLDITQLPNSLRELFVHNNRLEGKLDFSRLPSFLQLYKFYNNSFVKCETPLNVQL